MVYLILKKNKNDFAVFQQSILFTWPPFYLRIGVHARTTILIDTTLFKTSFMLTRFIFQNDTGLVNLMLYNPIPQTVSYEVLLFFIKPQGHHFI